MSAGGKPPRRKHPLTIAEVRALDRGEVLPAPDRYGTPTGRSARSSSPTPYRAASPTPYRAASPTPYRSASPDPYYRQEEADWAAYNEFAQREAALGRHVPDFTTFRQMYGTAPVGAPIEVDAAPAKEHKESFFQRIFKGKEKRAGHDDYPSAAGAPARPPPVPFTPRSATPTRYSSIAAESPRNSLRNYAEPPRAARGDVKPESYYGRASSPLPPGFTPLNHHQHHHPVVVEQQPVYSYMDSPRGGSLQSAQFTPLPVGGNYVYSDPGVVYHQEMPMPVPVPMPPVPVMVPQEMPLQMPIQLQPEQLMQPMPQMQQVPLEVQIHQQMELHMQHQQMEMHMQQQQMQQQQLQQQQQQQQQMEMHMQQQLQMAAAAAQHHHQPQQEIHLQPQPLPQQMFPQMMFQQAAAAGFVEQSQPIVVESGHQFMDFTGQQLAQQPVFVNGAMQPGAFQALQMQGGMPLEYMFAAQNPQVQIIPDFMTTGAAQLTAAQLAAAGFGGPGVAVASGNPAAAPSPSPSPSPAPGMGGHLVPGTPISTPRSATPTNPPITFDPMTGLPFITNLGGAAQFVFDGATGRMGLVAAQPGLTTTFSVRPGAAEAGSQRTQSSSNTSWKGSQQGEQQQAAGDDYRRYRTDRESPANAMYQDPKDENEKLREEAARAVERVEELQEQLARANGEIERLRQREGQAAQRPPSK